MRSRNINIFHRLFLIMSRMAGVAIITFSVPALAQEPPPRPIAVTVTAQTLSFGAFTHGAVGGSVTINPDGSRVSGGDVILLSLGYSFTAAKYEITANPGTLITLLNGPDVSLPGSGGGSMTLHIGSSSPASPFVTNAVPPAVTTLYVGGTLTVGNTVANPPGNYSGTFDITFVQE
jgi:hypothetical protein